MLIHEFCSIKRNDLQGEFDYAIIKNRDRVLVSDKIILWNIDFIDFKSKNSESHPAFTTHWQYIGDKHLGLDYHGISVILNEDLDSFIQVLEKYRKRRCIKKLRTLCIKAKTDHEDIVHCGI